MGGAGAADGARGVASVDSSPSVSLSFTLSLALALSLSHTHTQDVVCNVEGETL